MSVYDDIRAVERRLDPGRRLRARLVLVAIIAWVLWFVASGVHAETIEVPAINIVTWKPIEVMGLLAWSGYVLENLIRAVRGK